MPPLLRRLLLAPVAVVLLAGCADPVVPSAAGPEVRAAEQVFVEAPVVVPDALDGDLGTEWSSRGDGEDASITVDLGRGVRVGGVALRSRSMSDGSSVVETFTVTVDGGQTYGPFEAGTAAVVNELDVTGRVLRIDAVSTTGGYTGAAEIEVVEAA